MRSFTKGNWAYFDDADGFFSINAPDQLIAQTVARTFGHKAEDKANARLIAHAPEMYDNLCELTDFLEQKSCHECDEFARYARIIRKTLASIDDTED